MAGAMVHLRMSRIQLETPNKEFFNLEKAVKTSRQIHSLHSPHGVLTCQSDIKHSIQVFYSNLFTPRTVDKTMINEVIELLPSLSQEQQQQLECDISFEELTAASKLLEDGKAPGLDGLPAEFYKALWNFLGPTLINGDPDCKLRSG